MFFISSAILSLKKKYEDLLDSNHLINNFEYILYDLAFNLIEFDFIRSNYNLSLKECFLSKFVFNSNRSKKIEKMIIKNL